METVGSRGSITWALEYARGFQSSMATDPCVLKTTAWRFMFGLGGMKEFQSRVNLDRLHIDLRDKRWEITATDRKWI